MDDRGIVLVHCVAGYSRSPAFVAAYLMSAMNVSMEDALAAIGELRRVDPNDGFRKQLLIFQDSGEEPLDHCRYIVWCYQRFLALGDRAGMDVDTFFDRWRHVAERNIAEGRCI